MNCLHFFPPVPSFGFDPIAYTETENPGPTRFENVLIVESDGQTFAAGVTRSVFISSQDLTASMFETICMLVSY